MVSQLAQISDQAQLAPIRQQLQQIQLQEAQNQLASAPLARQLQLAQLAHASQPIEQVLGTELKRIPRINSPDETPAQDANGNYTFAEGDNNYDLVPIQRIAVTDPLTGQVTVQQKTLTPIATAEQLSDRADKLEIQKLREQSLADSRNTDRRLAEARLNSPEWTRLGYGIDPSTGKQAYLIVNKKTGERQAVPSDLVPVPTGQDALLAGMQALVNGGSAARPASAAITVPGLSGAATPAIDQEAQGLINDLSGGFKAPAASPAQTYQSPDEVRTAFRSGALSRADAEKILREQFGLK